MAKIRFCWLPTSIVFTLNFAFISAFLGTAQFQHIFIVRLQSLPDWPFARLSTLAIVCVPHRAVLFDCLLIVCHDMALVRSRLTIDALWSSSNDINKGFSHVNINFSVSFHSIQIRLIFLARVQSGLIVQYFVNIELKSYQ